MERMEIKKLMNKIPFWLFCIIMTISFFIGVSYPEETQFWIVRNAYPIILFELLSLFTTVFIFGFRIYKSIVAIGFVLLMSVGIAYYIASNFNIWLMPYFLISLVVKYIASKKIESISKLSKLLDNTMINSIPYLFSVFIALIFSSAFQNVFTKQIRLIFEFEKEFLEKNDFSQQGFSLVVLWGIIYFVFAFIFDIVRLSYESRYKKPNN